MHKTSVNVDCHVNEDTAFGARVLENSGTATVMVGEYPTRVTTYYGDVCDIDRHLDALRDARALMVAANIARAHDSLAV